MQRDLDACQHRRLLDLGDRELVPEYRYLAPDSDRFSIHILRASGVVMVNDSFVFGTRRAPVREAASLGNLQMSSVDEARVVQSVYHLETDSRNAALYVLADG